MRLNIFFPFIHYKNKANNILFCLSLFLNKYIYCIDYHNGNTEY